MISHPPRFEYTAAQIEQLTNGVVKLKTMNNWATNALWLTDLEPGRRGYPRKYSRANVIEAVLAAKMALIGMDRPLFKDFLAEQARSAKGIERLFAAVATSARLSWLMTPDYQQTTGDTAVWRVQTFAADSMRANIAELGDVGAVIPISNLIWQIDNFLGTPE